MPGRLLELYLLYEGMPCSGCLSGSLPGYGRKRKQTHGSTEGFRNRMDGNKERQAKVLITDTKEANKY